MKTNNKLRDASVRPVYALPGFVTLFLSSMALILAFTAGLSWSPDKAQAFAPHSSEFDSRSSPAMTDQCLPQLKSTSQTQVRNVMARNQRAAGKAAAIGLAFGLKYTLQSFTEIKLSNTKPNLWFHPIPRGEAHFGSGNVNALTIAQYRQCRKEMALGYSSARFKKVIDKDLAMR
jgi:hypothetical protein